jgi:hypothetical protein
MNRAVPRNIGEHVNRVYYSLLRATVVWLAPAALQFDEWDPLLGAGLDPERHGT